MTDEELNRAVAEARGWTPNTKVVRTAIAHALVNEFEPPDVCTDPAAWGGLLTQLEEEGYDVELLILPGMPANVRIRKPGALQSGYGTDAEIGRAVARAFLGSV
jgi:hypothetical protein